MNSDQVRELCSNCNSRTQKVAPPNNKVYKLPKKGVEDELKKIGAKWIQIIVFYSVNKWEIIKEVEFSNWGKACGMDIIMK